MSPIIGVKAYGWEWANEHALTMTTAAKTMVGQGIDWALVQNLIDPLPGSAVAQLPPGGAYADAAWVEELRNAGIRVYQSTAVHFSPSDFEADPGLRPVDQHGRVFAPFTWYYGICPTATGYLDRKVARFQEAVAHTNPDGVFLSFLRFPAFWEMWLPGIERNDIAEYCFCDRCLAEFAQASGIELPTGGTKARASLILAELRDEWTTWKCQTIAGIAAQLKRAAEEVCPGVDVILNSFGLGSADFGNAVEEVLGQRFADLAPTIDTFELMFYFQIQKRDPSTWIPQRLADARAQTDRTLLACLQGGAEYLEDVYAAGGRRREITAEDWRTALRGVAESGADGLLIYSWRDLLNDSAAGGSRVTDLLRYKNGEL